MMDILVEHSLYALIAANAFLICAAALAVSRFERRIRTNREFWDSPTGAAVKASNNSEAVLSGFLERRLALMHQRLNELDAKLDEGPQAPAVDPPFAHAARMARNGAGIDDLVRACGLTTAEAQLVHRLHAQADMAIARNGG